MQHTLIFRRLFFLTTLLGAWFSPLSSPLANSLEEAVGVGARSKAMGGVGTALGTDAAAVYYNIANISFGDENTLTLGYNHLAYGFYLDAVEGDAPELETMRPRDYITAGLTLQLPANLSFGLLLNLSPKNPQYFKQGSPDTKARFFMYGQRLEQISLIMGMSYRIADSLSLGLGSATLVNSGLDIENIIPYASDIEEELHNEFTWALEPNMGYYLGLSYRPSEKLHLGLTYKTALFHKMEGIAKTRIRAFGINIPFDLMLEVYSWYTPANASFGTTYNPTPAWTVSLDLTWYDWSSYPGPFLHTSAADESPVASGFLSYPERVDPEFVDTLVPRLGLEWMITPVLALRAGYCYRFSPAPLPRGNTNLLDNDMHQGSFGLGYRWNFEEKRSQGGSQGTSVARFYLDFDLYGTIGGIPETKVGKIPSDDPLKSYVFGGMVYDSGLLITLGF